MLVVVGVDSLVTMLETTVLASEICGGGSPNLSLAFGLGASVDGSADLGMGSVWGNLIGDCYGTNFNNMNGRQKRNSRQTCTAATGGVGIIDAFPFLAGNFRTSLQERKNLTKQVLDARLSALLCMLRKVNQYTQQTLGPPSGRARLAMIKETDQRLQLAIMKIRMLT